MIFVFISHHYQLAEAITLSVLLTIVTLSKDNNPLA